MFGRVISLEGRGLRLGSTDLAVEVHCRVKPGKPATGNDDSGSFHATLMNGILSGDPEIV